MGHGEIAVIVAVDEVPWAEVEDLSSKVKWVTVDRETLDKMLEILKGKQGPE